MAIRPDQAARLAGTALKQPGTFLAAFQRAELRAVARLLAGDPAGASAELDSAAATRLAGDLFRQPLYDLLHDPPVPGLARLLTIWKQITHVP